MKTPLHIGIIGATFAGNRGAEAMVRTVIDQISKDYPDCVFHVLSYLPKEDMNEDIPDNCFIEDARPMMLSTFWFAWGILAKVIPCRCMPLAKHKNGMPALTKLDIIVDVFGVSFMDNRLKFIPFNVLSLWPFLLAGVPVFKLSQAMGPFEKLLNRWSAKWVFTRLILLVARGKHTRQLLEDKGLWTDNCIESADIAFLFGEDKLPPPYHSRDNAVAIIPSSVVEAKLPGYRSKLISLAHKILDRGYHLKVVAHSWRNGSLGGRNNDMGLAMSIYDELSPVWKDAVSLVGRGYNAAKLKCEISRCQWVLTSRFHGMVSALSTGTPVFVIGWSHKYEEVLELFGQSQWALPYNAFEPDKVWSLIEQMDASRHEIAEQILLKRQAVMDSSSLQFKSLLDYLGHLGKVAP